VLNKNPRTPVLSSLTSKQASVIELADHGLTETEIAEQLATPVGVVRAQLTRVRRKVERGAYQPPPLPVEAAARRPRIYLAGFDVFRPDAVAHGETLKVLCRAFGFDGLYPLDAAVPSITDPGDRARWVYEANIGAIRQADIVLANANDFRGTGEPDSGTAFEIGFAVATGKPVWAYTTDRRALRERVPSSVTQSGLLCEKGFLVEDFGLPMNLMIACSTRIVFGDARACLTEIAATYASEGTPSSYRPNGES
jgi:nucleoside 2-deoxyribosyltransferase